MMDRYGNTIDEGLTVTYITAPYPPEVTLQTPGRTGYLQQLHPGDARFCDAPQRDAARSRPVARLAVQAGRSDRAG